MGSVDAGQEQSKHIVKTLILKLPTRPLARRTRLGRAGLILSGDRTKVGNYTIQMINQPLYTAFRIEPIERKRREFWTFDGKRTRVLHVPLKPRVTVPCSYFLWELEQGIHYNNIRLSKAVIMMLERVKELLID